MSASHHEREANRDSQKLFPFVTLAQIMDMLPYTILINSCNSIALRTAKTKKGFGLFEYNRDNSAFCETGLVDCTTMQILSCVRQAVQIFRVIMNTCNSVLFMDKICFFPLYDNIYNYMYIAIVVYIYYQIHLSIFVYFFSVFFCSIFELFQNYEFEGDNSFFRSVPYNMYVLDVIFFRIRCC